MGCWSRHHRHSGTYAHSGAGNENSRGRGWRRRSHAGGLRTDRANRRLMGVCAGLARHLDVSPFMVRAVLVLAVFLFQFWFLVPVYFALGFFLRDFADDAVTTSPSAATGPEPGPSPSAEAEASPAPAGGLPPHLRFDELRRRFADLEQRTGAMEREVTSSEFQLKREFRSFEDGEPRRSAG